LSSNVALRCEKSLDTMGLAMVCFLRTVADMSHRKKQAGEGELTLNIKRVRTRLSVGVKTGGGAAGGCCAFASKWISDPYMIDGQIVYGCYYGTQVALRCPISLY
jgi:hypothetical protein